MFLLLGTSLFGYTAAQAYSSLGCWNDAPPGEIQAIRWSVTISAAVADPVATCYNTAVNARYPRINVFGLQQVENNATVLRCSYQADVLQNGTYAYYGPSTACSPSGTGSVRVNHVYQINGRASMSEAVWESRGLISYGCYKESPGMSNLWGSWPADPFSLAANNARLGFSGAMIREHATTPDSMFGVGAMFDSFPGGTYASWGPSPFCRADGYGDKGIVRIFGYSRTHMIPRSILFFDFENLPSLNTPSYNFSSLGCFWTTGGNPPLYNFRHNDPAMRAHSSGWSLTPGTPTSYGWTPEQCYQLALQRGHNIFFIISRRYCSSTLDLIPYPRTLGLRSTCPTGTMNSSIAPPVGGSTGTLYEAYQIFKPTLNIAVYTTSPKWTHLGCYNFPGITVPAGVTLNEGNGGLTDNASLRVDAIGKCREHAKSIGHSFFIMRRGGQCLSSTTQAAFTSLGLATDCLTDLRGTSDYKMTITTRFPNGGVNLFQVVP